MREMKMSVFLFIFQIVLLKIDCKGSAFFLPTKIRKQIYQFLGSNKECLL